MSQVIEFVVGQKVWQGHGLMGGRDVDDASSGYYEYEFEALTAISDEWQAWLSDSEKHERACMLDNIGIGSVLFRDSRRSRSIRSGDCAIKMSH